MWKNILVWMLLSLGIASCASMGATVLDDLNFPLNDLQRLSIAHLPVGKRSESVNGREYYSEYFIINGGAFEPAGEHPVRHTVHIVILGDRRPYKMEVRVPVERRARNGQYELVKYDEGLARMITRRIRSALHKRRDDRNIIDDFRVF